MGKAKVLTTQEIRKMQLLQLDMLAELDRVCRSNHICYSIMSGTLLGAVRHKGYIPWDDDADIAMLRQDYEKFKQAANELDAQICYFQDHDTDPAYRWGYGKLRRTGTVYIRAGQEHIECRTGVFIDIFPLDDVPGHLPGQILQDFICFCMRKILWSEVGKINGNILHKTIYRVLSYIPVEFVFWITKHMSAKSRNDSDKRVRTLLFPSIGKLYVKNKLKERYGMPKKWFQELKEYTFEGKKLWGTKDYDAILTYTYGDYMTLPPEEERNQQALVSDYHF